MALWLADAPLILASRSKVRRMLLTAAGIPVETDPADLDERSLETNARSQSAGGVAALLAREKAIAVGPANSGDRGSNGVPTRARRASRFLVTLKSAPAVRT